MPTSDPVQLLLTTNEWANRNIMNACRGLSEEQFHQSFEMGLGNLHDTMLHVISAMRGWGDLLAEREQRPHLEGNYSPDELLAMHDETATDFRNSAESHPVDDLVTGSRGGRTFTFARGAVITHVTTHGMHHRAQCLNMLRHLGAEQPASSVVQWVLTEDS